MSKNLTILLLFIGSACWSQDYIDFYNYCNEGDKQVFLKNFEKGLYQYEKAFSLVNYVHAKYYEQASICAAKTEQFEKAYFYAKKAIIHRGKSDFLNDKLLKAFRQNALYKQLQDSTFVFKAIHNETVNLVYKREIDSLHYIDQNVVRNNKTVKGNYKIDRTNLPADKFELDDSIFKHLLTLIDKFGFPSEQNVGEESYANSTIIIHHNVRLPINSEHLPMLKKALHNGEFMPYNYALLYDQSRVVSRQEPLFYFGVPFSGELSEERKKEVNQKRSEYGIKPFEAFKFKKTKRSTSQRPLW